MYNVKCKMFMYTEIMRSTARTKYFGTSEGEFNFQYNNHTKHSAQKFKCEIQLPKTSGN